MTATRLDETDRRILDMLQTDARVSQADIARAVGMAPSAIHDRLRKLERNGLLAGKQLRIPPKAIGYNILAFVAVKATGHCLSDESTRVIAAHPAVQEMHLVAGEDCYMLKVRAKSTDALADFLREIGPLPDVAGLKSTICLDTIKETTRLPVLDDAADAKGMRTNHTSGLAEATPA